MKKKKKERKEERDIKYNEKDTFTHIFNGEEGEVGNGGLTEATSGGLITFKLQVDIVETDQTTCGLTAIFPF